MRSVCRFLAEYPLDSWAQLWSSVAQELRNLTALGLLAVRELSIPWSSEVFMTDASEDGFGVVSTVASHEIGEAQVAERRGWLSPDGREAPRTQDGREAEASDEDEAVRRGAEPGRDLVDAV